MKGQWQLTNGTKWGLQGRSTHQTLIDFDSVWHNNTNSITMPNASVKDRSKDTLKIMLVCLFFRDSLNIFFQLPQQHASIQDWMCLNVARNASDSQASISSSWNTKWRGVWGLQITQTCQVSCIALLPNYAGSRVPWSLFSCIPTDGHHWSLCHSSQSLASHTLGHKKKIRASHTYNYFGNCSCGTIETQPSLTHTS